MILFVFPFKAGFLYDKIKQLCDMKYNIVTQCMLKNNVFKMDKINLQVLGNICLKINSKLGGINHILAAKSRPAILKRPVMVMGADVSHPSPESRGLKPSIAAIVGNTISFYCTLYGMGMGDFFVTNGNKLIILSVAKGKKSRCEF